MQLNKVKPVLWGGIGEMKSNGGTQFYQQDRIYDSNYIALCISSAFNPYYIIYKKCNKAEDGDGIDISKRMIYHRGTVQMCKELMENTNIDKKDMTKDRIRKLTPKECFRLMGFCKRQKDGSFDDRDYENAASVCSQSQIYKQAGNSIVVNVLEAIFKQML